MADGSNAIMSTPTRWTASQARDKASSREDEPPREATKKSGKEGFEKGRYSVEMKGAMDVDGLEEDVLRRRDVSEGSGMAGRRWRKAKNVIAVSSSLVRFR